MTLKSAVKEKEEKMKLVKSVISICLMVCFMFMARTAVAQIKPGAFTVSPSIGAYFFEGNQNLKNDLTLGLSLGYDFTKHWGVEAAFNYVDTEIDHSDINVDTYHYHLDGLYHFMPCERFVPYIAAGAGGMTFNPDNKGMDNKDEFAANYGAGLKFFITDNVALRADVRQVIPFRGGDHYNNLLCTAGLTILFGGENECVEPTKAVEPPPKAVEAPKPKPVVEPPKDSDGDGVTDNIDKCPNTPKGATVNEVGCWVCKGINFDFDKSDIKSVYYPCLNEAVDIMKSQPAMKVEIQGHTDSIGTKQYNQKLSERRAIAVKNYMANKGIAKDRLCVKGFGFSDPVAPNTTEEGRAKNRRVQYNPISK